MNFLIFSLGFTAAWAYAPLREPGAGLYNDASFLQDVLERMNRNLDLGGSGSLIDLGNRMDDMSPIQQSSFGRQAKDAEFMDALDYDMMVNNAAGGSPSIRDTEYLQHSSLFGHKYMTGGGSEPNLKFKGTQKTGAGASDGIKTDAVLPAYCNPPNPCPVGYTAEDGCIETFENSAAFSRAYQASQDCMCDTEHMFDCPTPKENNNELDLTQQTTDFILNNLPQPEHKSLVAKKFYNKKSHDDQLTLLEELAQEAAAEHSANFRQEAEVNPFLEGEKLPIAAKKGHYSSQSA